MKIRVNSIESMGLLDGPGVRFVVFFQGCPLRCSFCHNPETWNITDGEEMDVDDIVSEMLKYKEYFGNKGGITASGGEPLMQAEGLSNLFKKAKAKGINTVLDTSGAFMNEDVLDVLKHTDICMLDYKMPSDELYRNHVGIKKTKIDDFLRLLCEKNIETIIRQVIIPGINDTPESMHILSRIKKQNQNVRKIELLKFKKFCMSKYDNMGISFKLKATREANEKDIEILTKLL